MDTRLALIDGLPELVAEQFQPAVWETHSWKDWEFKGGNALRSVVLAAGYCVSYYCPRSALTEDAVPKVEGVMFIPLNASEGSLDINVARKESGSIHLLSKDSIVLLTMVSDSHEYRVLNELLNNSRRLCCDSNRCAA
jgi:hypothetical protein